MAILRAAPPPLRATVIDETRRLPDVVDDAVAGQHLDPERARLSQNSLARLFAAVDDGRDRDTGALQVEGSLIGRIIGGIDADLLARQRRRND